MRRAALVLVSVLASACGGRLVPVDGGAGSDGAVFDASGEAGADATADGATDASDGGSPSDDGGCSYDASEDDPCTPPPDDLLYADPPLVSVAAGSYGAAKFTASGPWASDPSMYMWFAGSTLPLGNLPQVMTYGTPQTIIFLVPQSEVGQTFTFSVKGHAGNIERTAELTVNVTSCAPWPASMVCAGYECGFESDGCGGLLSCGDCPSAAPYCFLRECMGTMPTYCPSGQGTNGNGGCIPCNQTFTCLMCPAGDPCIGVQDMCICETGG